MPRPVVALPCGSRSTSRVGRSASARPAARLTAVVVLPTPPFWFTTAMVLRKDPVFHAPHYTNHVLGLGVPRPAPTTLSRCSTPHKFWIRPPAAEPTEARYGDR